MPDPARLDRILAALPPDDAAFLAALVEPPWKVRARRLAARDDAIREALALLKGDPNPTATLATLLCRPSAADAKLAPIVATIIAHSEGAGVKARQLRNVATGARSPWQ